MNDQFNIAEKDGYLEIKIPVNQIINGNENDFIFFLGFMEHAKNKIMGMMKLKKVMEKNKGIITPKVV